jgi:hypothetical protein
MTPIKIPDILKPDVGIMHGYTGGMGLYVVDWDSVQTLYELTNTQLLAYNVTEYYKHLN